MHIINQFEVALDSGQDGTASRLVGLDNGNYAVVWQDGATIQARIVDANGRPILGEPVERVITVATNASGATIASVVGGGFIIAWDQDGAGVRAQTYNYIGLPVGETVKLPGAAGERTFDAAISRDHAGHVLIYQETEEAGRFSLLKAQVIGTNGTLLENRTLVPLSQTIDNTTVYGPVLSAVESVGTGYAVAWHGNIINQPLTRLDYVQTFTDTGAATSPLRIDFKAADIAALADGSYVVVGTALDTPDSAADHNVVAQRFSGATGQALGERVIVNTRTAGSQNAPSVTALTDGSGGFVVAWSDDNLGQAQTFDADMGKVGGEFRVTSRGGVSDIAADALGGFMAVWNGKDPLLNEDREGLRGQTYRPAPAITNGADVLTTQRETDDVINALGGSDTIFASSGVDRIDGGAGNDVLRIVLGDRNLFDTSTPGGVYQFRNGAFINSDSTKIDTSFVNVERLVIDFRGERAEGNQVDALAAPTGVQLTLVMGDGYDQIRGSAGNDLVYMGLGGGTFDGQQGNNQVVVSISAVGGTATVSNQDGNAVVTQAGVATTVWDVDELVVGDYGDTFGHVIDASAINTDDPGVYVNFLILADGRGNDTLIGGRGADIFAGINSSSGRDTYTGGGGADLYDFTFAVAGLDGTTITDFDLDDTIDLGANTAELNTDGVLADRFIGTAAFTGVAGEYRFEAGGGQTLVQVDTNGDRVADGTLTIANGVFQLTAVTDDYGSNNALRAVANSAYAPIDGAYRALGGRPASSSDLAYWTSALASGATIADVRSAIINDALGAQAIASVYQQGLGRMPSDGEIAYWRNAFLSGSDLSTLREAVAGAAVEQARVDRSIDALYQAFGGQHASASDLSYWRGQLASGTTLDGVRNAIVDDQLGALGIAEDYRDFLARDPLAEEIAYWRGAYKAGTPAAALNAAILDSDEGVARADMGVDVLYRDFGGRAARAAELDVWRGAIRNGANLDDIRDVIVEDALGAQAINTTYRTYMGRTATNGEIEVWQDLFKADAPAASLRQAILGTEEGAQHSAGTIRSMYEDYFGRAAEASEVAVWLDMFRNGVVPDTLLDTLFTHPDARGQVTTLTAQVGAETLTLGKNDLYAVNGFNPAEDTLDLRSWGYSGVNPLADAREIVSLSGRTDVLLGTDPDHQILLTGLSLSLLSTSDFLV
ncbi:hypothetical protein [Sphingomonas jatrophae]|uniref:DUF4214 domain-containing protein n=1 Tax=Sphingomonas jatrophae TaxID=1166337 RepID=A0A1I6JM12_9SPHN|nr:hypothetical protein [Sphingomonas jatrophae]SFR80018.1 hypothetical protein SAMN05192580_0510 [Sphingomonas jatrophae]